MSTTADLAEANIRIKRWAKAACESGHVVGGCNPEVTHSVLRPVASRWRIMERLKWARVTDMGADTPDVIGTPFETECCVAAAQTWGELLHKYALWAADPNRVAYFQDRDLRGQSQHQPPPEPPEWREHRNAMVAAAAGAGERTSEWITKSARGQMARLGMDDPVKFAVAWKRLADLGMVPK